MTPTPDRLDLRVESDVVTCRQAVRRLAQSLRFSLVDQTRLITAASELARNTLVYGGGGEMRWSSPMSSPSSRASSSSAVARAQSPRPIAR